jgi:glycosyltransferase involved in cell wall biosynthesis
MRIGFDAKRLYNNFTGLGSYSRALVHDLNHYFPDNEYFLYTPKVKKDLNTQEFFQNPAFKTVTSSSLNPFWRSYFLAGRLEKDQLDIYHGLSHELPINIEKSKVKSVVTIHDLIFKVYPKNYSLIDRSIYDWKFRSSCINSDKIIAISESTKKDIVNFYGIGADKIKVIYQTCNPLFYKNAQEDAGLSVLQEYKIPKEYLLYVGSIIPRKNLNTILRSYEHLSKDLRIPLVIVGKGGAYKKECQELIKEKKLESVVLWIDNLKDNRHLQLIYKSAQALIYPSLYEGFGIPIVEALLCRTPVITSGVSSLPEAGGSSSFYLRHPEDPEEMAKAIDKVLSDACLQEKMKEEGYAYAKKTFDPKTITEQVYSLYKEIVR